MRSSSPQHLTEGVHGGVQRPAGPLWVGLMPQPAHEVVLGHGSSAAVCEEILEYRQRDEEPV